MAVKRINLKSRAPFLRLATAAIFMSSVLLLAGRFGLLPSVTALQLSSPFSRVGRRHFCQAAQLHRCYSLQPESHAYGFQRQHPYSSRSGGRSLWATATDDDEVEGYAKTVESEWNVPGLKKEVIRLVLRCHKKIGKANQRISKAQKIVDQLTGDESASLEDLEECPDIDTLEFELTELQSRLRKLNALEESLQSIKAKKEDKVLPEEVASLAVDLGVDDQPPSKIPRGITKPKGPRESESTRLPYRRYYSFGGVEIRVGKQAEDNDELTMSPQHRDGADWWMHASGCPGSHIVIRSHDQQLPEEVVQDAAALAARQSKCNTATIKVSLTRCRDIKKPPGAKAGLVMLTGQVRTVSVNMKEAETRLQRLDATVLVN
jgi:predicted ribosome quality control (RQC) complex YloA/Tae2 family protein